MKDTARDGYNENMVYFLMISAIDWQEQKQTLSYKCERNMNVNR